MTGSMKKMIQRIVRFLLSGAVLGVALSLFGMLVKLRKTVKKGVFVEFNHLQRDPYIVHYTKQLRPYFQTSKVSVSLGFRKFVTMVDEAMGNPSQFKRPHFILDAMSLLSDDRRKPNQSAESLQLLKQDMRTLLTDLVVKT